MTLICLGQVKACLGFFHIFPKECVPSPSSNVQLYLATHKLFTAKNPFNNFPPMGLIVFLFFFFFLIYLFLAALGLRCCTQAFSSGGKRGLLFLVRASHCAGFSCRGAQALGAQAQ